MTTIDNDLIDIYKKDELWKKDEYYYALLEQVLVDSFRQEIPYPVIKTVYNWMNNRKQYILEKTFTENGKVNITSKKETVCQKWIRKSHQTIKKVLEFTYSPLSGR